MKFIRVGKKQINPRYLILSEEYEGFPDDPPPGTVRATIESGRILHFTGDRADQFLRGLEEAILGDRPPPGIATPRTTASVEPAAVPLPTPRRRKSKG
jgi:hypothetical protein